MLSGKRVEVLVIFRDCASEWVQFSATFWKSHKIAVSEKSTKNSTRSPHRNFYPIFKIAVNNLTLNYLKTGTEGIFLISYNFWLRFSVVPVRRSWDTHLFEAWKSMVYCLLYFRYLTSTVSMYLIPLVNFHSELFSVFFRKIIKIL